MRKSKFTPTQIAKIFKDLQTGAHKPFQGAFPFLSLPL